MATTGDPYPTRTVHFVLPGTDQPPAGLLIHPRFVGEQPQLGDPGKKPGDTVLVQSAGAHTLWVSLGLESKATSETFRKAGGAIGKWLLENPAESADLSVEVAEKSPADDALQALLEGILLGAYVFDRYKQNPDPQQTISLLVRGTNPDKLSGLLARVEIIADSVLLAREWGHEPANVINPVSLAERAQELAARYGLKCTVLDEKALESLAAGAILAVGKGSQTPPRLIVLEYPGQADKAGEKPVVLVGKALTFDSGGYSLKDTTNIQGMKYDKCGGVTVLAVMAAAARLKLDHPLVGVIGAAENMVSENAYRPDDIITTLSKKTVEIVSTDAEGRLVLADALTYAQSNYQPKEIIDLATLTGGVVVALGRVRAGIMSNHQGLTQALIDSGEKTWERLWQLPLDDDYLQSTKGDDADLKNSGGREGHAILGGIFLKQFVDDSIPWAHLDIAGLADVPKDLPYCPKGATGFGVRLLIDHLSRLD